MLERRNAKISYGKNGNGFTTTRITLPVPWLKKLGFNQYNKYAIIELNENEITIRKEEIDMDEKLLKKIVIAKALRSSVEEITDDDVSRLEQYITINKAANGKEYIWYFDCDECEAVADMQGNIVEINNTADFFGIK